MLDTPIRILHLISGLASGGAERVLTNLAVGLSVNRQFSCIVVSMTDRGPFADQIEAHGVPVYTLDMRRGRPSLQGIKTLRNRMKEFAPDIMQTWLYHADLLGLAVCGFSEIPHLVWNLRCSDMDLRRYRLLTRGVVSLLSRYSKIPSTVVVNSEAGRSHHLRIGYQPRHWEVIPNGFDSNVWRPDLGARKSVRCELGFSVSAPLVGYVARLDPAKDHKTFLQAARSVLEARADCQFLLVGDGVSTLRGEVAALRISDSVRLLDRREDIPRLTAALDVACLSSAWGEGFPNAIGEAMACGVPCVATDVGDVANILSNTGHVVSPGSVTQFSAAILKLLACGETARQALGASARARIMANYSLQAMIEQYGRLYRNLAGHRSSDLMDLK